MRPKVFVILINWNGEEDTIVCLDSLLGVDYEQLHVVISDNGSREESLNSLRSWLTANVDNAPRRGIASYVLIENGANLGFTGANRTGIAYAMANEGDYVLFLNNDTVVTREFLGFMVAAAETDPRVGIAGCKIFSGAPNDGTGKHPLWCLGGYTWKGGIPWPMEHGKLDSSEWKGIRENDTVNGCCMLIKRRVIETVGVQDDELFFGMDDVEYSLRANRGGWRNLLVLDASIYHIGSHGVKAGSPLQAYYLFRNMPLLRAKCFRWYQNLVFILHFSIRYVLMGAIGRRLLGRGRVNRGMWLGIYDYFAGKTGECRHSSLVRRPREI